MADLQSLGYDKRMRKVSSLGVRRTDALTPLDQEMRFERNPYAPPTMISKGTVSTTAGGLVDFKDNTGSVSVFTYDPESGSITINGYLTVTNPINFGSNMTVLGVLTVQQGVDITGPGTTTNTGLEFKSANNGSAFISFANTGGNVRAGMGIDASGFGYGTVDQLSFRGNINNNLQENFGVVAQLADSSGGNYFKVRNSNGETLWYFASHGEVYQGKPAMVELLGTIASPGNGPNNTARLFVGDNGGGKDKLAVQFQSGTAVTIAVEP